MDLSIIVVAHNMSRELPRTIRTLSSLMQRECGAISYEVIVLENGSTQCADLSMYHGALDLRTIVVPPQQALPSPVIALNAAIAEARGDLIGLMIDGARMASPGLLKWACRAGQMHDRAVIITLGFHLGDKVQMASTLEGYNQEIEDGLLASVRWEEDGYRLFDISVLAGSSRGGWFEEISESNAIFMHRRLWDELGGLDERFRLPGGGLASLDLLTRATSLQHIEVFTILGEGTFHQCHGGIATNALTPTLNAFFDDYKSIKGSPYVHPSYKSSYIGDLHSGARRFIGPSAQIDLTVGSMQNNSNRLDRNTVNRPQIAPLGQTSDGTGSPTAVSGEFYSRAPSALVIMGMHRSGTSALAGSVCELGYSLPGETLPLAEDNPKGYFECLWVRGINDRFLKRLGTTWEDPFPVDLAGWERLRLDDLVSTLEADLSSAFATSSHLVFKDPRICILTPIWIAALERLKKETAFILIGRAPAEVIASLMVRNKFSRPHAAMLWLKHVLLAERMTRGRRRCAITYDRLLTAPGPTFARIAAAFGCHWPNDLATVDERISSFLEPSLRHHEHAEFSYKNAVDALCMETWKHFQDLVIDEADLAVQAGLDAVYGRITAAGSLFAPLLQDGVKRKVVPAPAPQLNGLRIWVPNRPEVWLVLNGRRHHIVNSEVYNNLFSEVRSLYEMATVEHIERGPDLADGTCLIKGKDFPDIYLLKRSAIGGVYRHRIRSYDIFKIFDFDPTKVRELPSLAVTAIPEGVDIE